MSHTKGIYEPVSGGGAVHPAFKIAHYLFGKIDGPAHAIPKMKYPLAHPGLFGIILTHAARWSRELRIVVIAMF